MSQEQEDTGLNREGNRRGKGGRFSQDPYSMAMMRIVPSLRKALQYQGAMSDDEHMILEQIRRVIERNDPVSLKSFEEVKDVRVIRYPHAVISFNPRSS